MEEIERVLRFGGERYLDAATGRMIAVGKHERLLVMIPYDIVGDDMVPVTIHATTRQQVNFRIQSGRFRHG